MDGDHHEALGVATPSQFRFNGTLEPSQDFSQILLEEYVGGRQAQYRRRSHIFATVRRLMSLPDFDHLGVQDIAAQCGVAVQTLYNLTGTRADLIDHSIEEYGTAGMILSRSFALSTGEDPILSAMRQFWRAGIEYPQYVNYVATLARSSARTQQRFWLHGSQAIERDLRKNAAAGQVRDTVHIASLARQLSRCANLTILNWSLDPFPTSDLWRELVNGPGLMLASAMQGEGLHRVETTINAIHREYCVH